MVIEYIVDFGISFIIIRTRYLEILINITIIVLSICVLKIQ